MSNKNYPENHQEFLQWFRSDADCWDYLFKLRWPNGFICPSCLQQKGWRNCRNLMHCSNCAHQTSVTASTIFQGTRKPLLLWFNVIWSVMVQKTGCSAKNLQEAMGFGSYETAWAWLHKLRRAMVRQGREKLKGIVEVDETYIGGAEKASGKRGRATLTKTLVVVATECLGRKIGRVRFRCITNASAEELIPFIHDNIEMGSTVITDGWEGYSSLENGTGYIHEKKVISGSGKKAHELLPHVHMVDALVKKWINGTHQGAILPKHLPYYLDEYAFRFNRKLSTHRGMLFYRLIQQSLATHAKPIKTNC